MRFAFCDTFLQRLVLFVAVIELAGVYIACEASEVSEELPMLCRMAANPAIESIEDVAATTTNGTRIVAVADIHGAHDELIQILNGAGIIDMSSSGSGSCEWIQQPPGGTTLIQMGDVVDRGPGATEAWECLDALQRNAPPGSDVVRLVGNHELWWLEGLYHDRNKVTDSIEECKDITQKLREGIRDESIVASYVRHIGGVPVMFVHAGYRKDMINFMKWKYSINGAADELSAVTNSELRKVILNQNDASRIALPRGSGDELFEAGAERGGNRIGGPFWTDFKILQNEFDSTQKDEHEMIQIVGHTAQHGSFRGTPDLSAICIDAAMYRGTSTYLEIGYDQHFRLNLLKNNEWKVQDVTLSKCDVVGAQ